MKERIMVLDRADVAIAGRPAVHEHSRKSRRPQTCAATRHGVESEVEGGGVDEGIGGQHHVMDAGGDASFSRVGIIVEVELAIGDRRAGFIYVNAAIEIGDVVDEHGTVENTGRYPDAVARIAI